MLHHRPTPERRNPEDILAGTCGTCGTHVEAPRWQTTTAPQGRLTGKEPGAWNDLVFAECPHCQARVYVVLKTDHYLR